jgi:NitT/TauT family transport system permease protein/taurine transport system permease protein
MTSARRPPRVWLGLLPFGVVAVIWWVIPQALEYPAYMLPAPDKVLERYLDLLVSGDLWMHTAQSLRRLATGFVLGNALALIIGIGIASNRDLAAFLSPTLTFLQSIAGVAWVPLAIIWFGSGNGAVLFVVTNAIFFSCLNNAVVGVQQIPNVLYRAARSNGANSLQVLRELVLPGALVQIIVGLRTSLAYGWRALVAGEMIASAKGLGTMTFEAIQWYQTATVISGMITIGLIWLLLDRLIFRELEKRTVRRWGMLR